MYQKMPQEEDLEIIRKTLEDHNAAEDAAFAAQAQLALLKNIRDRADRIIQSIEQSEQETPYLQGAKTASLMHESIPWTEESLPNLTNEIVSLGNKLKEAVAKGRGAHENAAYCQEAHNLAAEFSATLVVDPDLKGGMPCVRGLRITVFDVLELLTQGQSIHAVLKQESSLKEADIADCIRFAKRLKEVLDGPPGTSTPT